MESLFRYPTAVLLVTLAAQWLAAFLGHVLRKRVAPSREEEKADFNTILGATLTLLALIIGFSFSMAIDRYDQRVNLEEAEANAIGDEYVRVDLLPPADAARTRSLLASYTQARIQFYRERDPRRIASIAAATAKLQGDLWTSVTGPANAHQTPTTALAAAGMTDVLNAQGYTQAAWRNHIPAGAWALMLLIAAAGNFLLGASQQRRAPALLIILPLIVSAPLFLIADTDSPRQGLIRIEPANLVALANSLPPPH